MFNSFLWLTIFPWMNMYLILPSCLLFLCRPLLTLKKSLQIMTQFQFFSIITQVSLPFVGVGTTFVSQNLCFYFLLKFKKWISSIIILGSPPSISQSLWEHATQSTSCSFNYQFMCRYLTWFEHKVIMLEELQSILNSCKSVLDVELAEVWIVFNSRAVSLPIFCRICLFLL